KGGIRIISIAMMTPMIAKATKKDIMATNTLPPSMTEKAPPMVAQPSSSVKIVRGDFMASISSKACSATDGGVKPVWMERIRRSTADNLVKLMVHLRAERTTVSGCRFEPVPMLVWMVIVFMTISTWQ